MQTTIENRSQKTEEDDDSLVAHYAEKDEIMRGFVYGIPIVALCGKVWVPSRDGEGYPVCDKCKEIYAQLSH